MKWRTSAFALLAAVILLSGLYPSAVQAAPGGDMVKVTVNLMIDNPDYFWHYPFAGKQVDSLRVSGVGKYISVMSLSSGQKLEFDVPRGYQFRMAIDLMYGSALVSEVRLVKDDIRERNNSFTVVLKAPPVQPVVVNSTGFDESSVQ